ncbi:DUF4221 family protein [uncultured Algoriphagus sp.]|uniref:DUF4221 family protein n=1 Tax=uncultured Algoriphagus sp. TaxID=417365 RepID=UPI0030EF89D6|tara:strand:+ start:43559 stop:44737 length:1179 start_codon:yes stop_codon:yes gene_type:complete
MYQRIVLLSCFLLFLSLLSCQSKEDSYIERIFKEVGFYQINLDQFTSPVEDYVQYVKNWKGKEAFAFHVRGKDEIKIYDLASGELFDTIAYNSQGPTPFQGIYDFNIINEDSIFLNKRYLYKTYLVNSDYKVISELNFLEDGAEVDAKTRIPVSGDTFMLVFSHNRLLTLVDGVVYLTASPDKNARQSEYFDSGTVLVSYDLADDSISKRLGFSEKLKNKAWGPLHANAYADYNKEEGKFIISYEADENLYLVDRGFKFTQEFEATPNNYNEILPISASANNEAAYLVYFNEQFRFGSVLYDPYRKLIYRIALEPNPNYGMEFINDPLFKPRNMVVMAFDAASFDKKAEMELRQSDAGAFLDRCFVNERGLNIFYMDFANEDKLFFKTFLLD